MNLNILLTHYPIEKHSSLSTLSFVASNYNMCFSTPIYICILIFFLLVYHIMFNLDVIDNIRWLVCYEAENESEYNFEFQCQCLWLLLIQKILNED